MTGAHPLDARVFVALRTTFLKSRVWSEYKVHAVYTLVLKNKQTMKKLSYADESACLRNNDLQKLIQIRWHQTCILPNRNPNFRFMVSWKHGIGQNVSWENLKFILEDVHKPSFDLSRNAVQLVILHRECAELRPDPRK